MLPFPATFSFACLFPQNYANTGSVDQAPLCFELDLKCDAVTKYFQLPNVDAILGTNKQACLRARVESQHGCVTNAFKALHLTSWKILFFIIAPLAMVSGLMLTFLGWRLFRITSLVLGLFFGLLIAGMAILFSVFLACEATKVRVLARGRGVCVVSRFLDTCLCSPPEWLTFGTGPTSARSTS